MAIKESTHWYSQDGKPQYTIIGVNGKERGTTLRDARKHNYVPSVTSILGLVAKPGLENWKIDQALMSALTLPRQDGESLDDFMLRAKRDAKEQSIQAARAGTEIHARVERGFSGSPTDESERVRAVLQDATGKGMDWIAEDSFCAPEGYGGKIDLYSDNVVVDLKTKEGIAGADPARLVYDEHGMQLSAYAHGVGMKSPTRVSVFIDRADPTIVLAHVWEDTHQKHITMFLTLLEYWKLVKNYVPAHE